MQVGTKFVSGEVKNCWTTLTVGLLNEASHLNLYIICTELRKSQFRHRTVTLSPSVKWWLIVLHVRTKQVVVKLLYSCYVSC